MTNSKAESDKMVEILRHVAMSCTDAQETISCKGTAIQSATFKIKGKSFLFVRPGNVMVKLGESLENAGKLAVKYPNSLKVGKGGWTTITDPGSIEIPLDLLKNWVKESYSLFYSSGKKHK